MTISKEFDRLLLCVDAWAEQLKCNGPNNVERIRQEMITAAKCARRYARLQDDDDDDEAPVTGSGPGVNW